MLVNILGVWLSLSAIESIKGLEQHKDDCLAVIEVGVVADQIIRFQSQTCEDVAAAINELAKEE